MNLVCTRRKWRNTWLTTVLLLVCILCCRHLITVHYLSYLSHHTPEQEEIQDDRTNSKIINPEIKKIMDFNPRPTNTHNFTFSKCEYSACAMTSDPTQANLLMFDGLMMQAVTLPQRPAGQIWLIYTREPPVAKRFRYLKRQDLRNQFNWTRTILNDSTFPVVYGILGQRTPPKKDYETIFKRKKHVVAWFVSKCKTSSKREDYVRRMASQVSVHIYGLCGNRICGSRGYDMGGNKTECLEMISKSYIIIGGISVTPVANLVQAMRMAKYKDTITTFYLSFENSFCRDYITEKFFAMFREVDVIPVVRGGGDYRKLFPSGIYVSSRDFQSPERLGKYLNALSRDMYTYIKLLKFKNSYTLVHGASFSCDLCKALHKESPQNVYADIYSWLLRPGNCWAPEDLEELHDG